jgi:predicted amino acid racemase
MFTPRLEICLGKIAHNASALKDLYGARGIRISAVTKVVCGDPRIAAVLVECGIERLADSRISNIRRMQEAGIESVFMLLRGPSLSQAADVVAFTDVSLNSDLSVIRELSRQAVEQRVVHGVILMVELGDLREGLMPADLQDVVKQVLELDGIALVGLGANLACFAGIRPDDTNMARLSRIAGDIEARCGVELTHVSGGNSANYAWFMSAKDLGRINDLRLGESIFLGCETLFRDPIEGLFTDAFTLVAEVIESITKPSLPRGEACQNAAGQRPEFRDRGDIRRVILGMGSQDVVVSGLTPRAEVDILGSSSDHIILDGKRGSFVAGDELEFDLDYGALLSAMTSPYVEKVVV